MRLTLPADGPVWLRPFADSIRYNIVNGPTFTGYVTFDGNEAPKFGLVAGASDHCYLEFYPRASDPTDRGAYIGFRVAAADALSFNNEISGNHEFFIDGVLKFSVTTLGSASEGSIKPASYTVATLPSAATHGAGAVIYVSDETGGAVIAFSDGTDWRRMTDRAVVS